MEKIRIGNDISVTWGVMNSGEPYDLSGKDLKLYLSSPNRIRIEIRDFQVDGNVISFVFYGKDQKATGIYSCTLVENEGQKRMLTVDSCNVFQLVDWSCRAVSDSSAAIDLQSDILVNVVHPIIPEIGENGHWWIDGEDTGKPAYMEAGMSAYDIAVTHGFEGTEEEWLQSLKGAAGGPNIPVYDLLTSGYWRENHGSETDILYDYRPCLRFRGPSPGESWSVEIYMYRNTKNKGWRRILSSPLSECDTQPLGNGYQSVFLPWTLMRIFWELFDPVSRNDKSPFHSGTYDPESVANGWIVAGSSGSQVKKYKKEWTFKKTSGSMFSGSFGIRIANTQDGVYGEMRIFRILLRRLKYRNREAYRTWFAVKMDGGPATFADAYLQ